MKLLLPVAVFLFAVLVADVAAGPGGKGGKGVGKGRSCKKSVDKRDPKEWVKLECTSKQVKKGKGKGRADRVRAWFGSDDGKGPSKGKGGKRPTTRGAKFAVDYDSYQAVQNNRSAEVTHKTIDFVVRFTDILEFESTDQQPYNPNVHNATQRYAINDFQSLEESKVDGAHMFTLTTTDNTARFTSAINETAAINGDEKISPNFFKVDIQIKDFPYTGAANATKLVVVANVDSVSKVHRHEKKCGGRKDQKDVACNGPKGGPKRTEKTRAERMVMGDGQDVFGLFSWDTFVTTSSGNNCDIVTSEADEEDDKHRRVFFTILCNDHPSEINWDPEIGVAYGENDDEDNGASPVSVARMTTLLFPVLAIMGLKN